MRIEALAACALLALTSCETTTLGGTPCTTDAECGPGRTCMNGACRALDPTCGDGVRAAGEECDDGSANGDGAACTRACRLNVCGDGRVHLGVEACDEGNTHVEACAYGLRACEVCDATCQLVATPGSFCGDGVVDAASGEACDDGNDEEEACAYGQTSCTVCGYGCRLVPGATSYCGDGVRDAASGELCDGGGSPLAGCPYGQLACTRCGPTCTFIPGAVSFCGDGRVQGSEECDDGNFEEEPCPYGELSCQVCDWTCHFVDGATSYCGDGAVDAASGEGCDVVGPGCTECAVEPGWDCNPDCVPRGYRVALVGSSGLLVRNLAATGGVSTVRDVLRGYNTQSLRPAWSLDGSLVAYPVGDYLNETYLYEGAGTNAALDSFVGTQPNFGAPPSKVVARRADGYAVWDASTLLDSGASIASAAVREPTWEPGGTARFAYLDELGGVPGALEVFTGAGSFAVAAQARRYAWAPGGGALVFVAGGTSCSAFTADVGSASASSPVQVASGVPCDALLAVSPDGERLALASGAKLFEVPLTGAVSDVGAGAGLAYQGAGNILDLAYSPDGDFALTLAFDSGASGTRRVFMWSAGMTAPLSSALTCSCERMAIAPVTFAP